MNKLKQARIRAGLTQLQVAEKSGLHEISISRWETGKRLPRIDVLKKLAEVYNCKVADLI